MKLGALARSDPGRGVVAAAEDVIARHPGAAGIFGTGDGDAD
jgi:hypothetical protein